MRQYTFGGERYYTGPTAEIASLLKCIRRAAVKGKTKIVIPYSKPAIFSRRKQQYALRLDEYGAVHVISSDEMMAILDENM